MRNLNLRKKTLAIGISIITLLFFCSTNEVSAQQTINGNLTHDGLERTYILYVPANYTGNEAVPLLFNFHGYTSNAFDQMGYGNFRPIADTEGFIIVHPMGTVDNNSTTHFNVGWGTSEVDDVGFTEALIDELSSNYMIDAKRVYSTGFSNGGFMSYKLACDLSERFAAVASVGGTRTSFQTCEASHQTPVMEIHGTNDGTVPYDGSTSGFEAVETVVEFWAEYNECDKSPIITDVPDTNTTDDSTVEHQLYTNGTNGAEVELYKVINGGHTWPGSTFAIPDRVTNYDIDASAKIWEFFAKYTIDGALTTLSVNEFNKNDNPFTIYPNPSNSYFTIDNKNAKDLDYQIISIAGQVVATGKTTSSSHEISLTSLAPGMYIIKVGEQSYKITKTN